MGNYGNEIILGFFFCVIGAVLGQQPYSTSLMHPVDIHFRPRRWVLVVFFLLVLAIFIKKRIGIERTLLERPTIYSCVPSQTGPPASVDEPSQDS